MTNYGNEQMKKKLKDFGAVKNSITGKTIREMTWDEILDLARDSKPMSTEEAMSHFRAARLAYLKGKSA